MAKAKPRRNEKPKSPASPPPKRTGGYHPPFVPTDQDRAMVQVAVVAGCVQESICRMLRPPAGISLKTLRKHFRTELSDGDDVMKTLAVGTLARAMRSGGKEGVTAAIFTLKVRAKWRDGARSDDEAAAPAKITFTIAKPPPLDDGVDKA